MKDPNFEPWREAGWRGKPTPAEEARLRAWLAEHPEDSAEWQAERQLTEALGRLPNAPVPSNFTAQVLREVEREGQTRPGPARWWPLHGALRWLPRVALASVVLAAGLLPLQHVRNMKRQERAESVKEIVSAASVPGPEILQDYDAILAMGQPPAADVELLNALQ